MSNAISWEETTAAIKEQADIVQIIGDHVDLKRSGARYLGNCPFHQEKTPSFSVHPGQQFYYCFGCGASGDVFSFMMNYHHMDFPEAMKVLAQRYQIALPEKKHSARDIALKQQREAMFQVNLQAATIFRRFLLESADAQKARRYLSERGIGDALQETYLLGYAPATETNGWNFLGSRLDTGALPAAIETGLLAKKDNGTTYDRFRDRIMFPIFDRKGRVAGFGGRILGSDNPKYLNSPESLVYNKSRLLFGLFHQYDAIRTKRRVALVEGNFDLLSLLAHGLDTVVAPLGTALTKEQVRLLKPLVDEVILLFDGDPAGVKAAERVVTLFLAEQVSARVAILPEEHDPDSFVRENGLQALQQRIEKAESLPEFVLERMVSRHGLTLDGKIKIVEDLKPLMAAASSDQQRSVMASHFAARLGLESGALFARRPASVPGPPSFRSSPDKRLPERDPLDGGLKSLVRFMLLNPSHLPDLEKAGVRDVLAGTLGEVLFLQLKVLHDKKKAALQPEDVLTELPEGEERSLVAALLLDSVPDTGGGELGEDGPTEGEEFVGWVRRKLLKRKSDQLVASIGDAQKNNDFILISDLLRQKMALDNELKER